MVKVGDRLSLAILGLCCGGTFIALALTSVAKKAGQTGPPEKPEWPWLQTAESSFEERLKRMDIGGVGSSGAAASSSSSSAGNGGSSKGAS